LHKAPKQRFGSQRLAFVSSIHALLQAAALRFMRARRCSSECATFTPRRNMRVCNSDITQIRASCFWTVRDYPYEIRSEDEYFDHIQDVRERQIPPYVWVQRTMRGEGVGRFRSLGITFGHHAPQNVDEFYTSKAPYCAPDQSQRHYRLRR